MNKKNNQYLSISSRYFLLLFFLLTCEALYGQELTPAETTGMRSGGKIYVVIGVLTIIWLGFGIYLFMLEKRLRRLENRNNDTNQSINN